MTDHHQTRHFNFPTKEAASKARSRAGRYGVRVQPAKNESIADTNSVVVVGSVDALEDFARFAFPLGGTSPTS